MYENSCRGYCHRANKSLSIVTTIPKIVEYFTGTAEVRVEVPFFGPFLLQIKYSNTNNCDGSHTETAVQVHRKGIVLISKW